MKLSAKFITLCTGLAIVGLMLTAPSGAAVDPGSVIGVWLMDEGGGDVVKDYSGEGQNGTVVGNASWGAGKIGGAMVFDGETHVEIPDTDATRLGTSQSLTLWLNPTEEVGDWCRLVGKGAADPRNFGMWRENAGWLLYQIYADGGAGNAWESGNAVTEAPLGEWTHMAGSYDGTEMILYVNGVPVFTAAFDMTPWTSEDPLTFGAAVDMHGWFFGSIDEIGIFNSILSEDDVNTIMNDGLGAVVNLTAVSSQDKLAVTWGGIKE